MPNAITILHISDMQFGKFHRFTEKNNGIPNPHDTLTNRLIDDLKHLTKENQLRPDLILCTGDLAEWGMPKEFTDAFAFLGKLCEHYSLPRSRCIVIPGNHDINRFTCSAYFDECKGNGEAPVFPWFPKWKHYKAAFDTFYAGITGITFDPQEPWTLFLHEDIQVVVAGLNSTMDEGHDGAVNAPERGDTGHHGLCTEPQLAWFKERLSDPKFAGWLCIGAVHHNTIRGCRRDDENLRDADLLGGILGQHLHLLLHGHTHEAKADVLARTVPVYSTGSASLKTGGEAPPVPTDIPNQYQFLVIDRSSITRYCRQYAPRNTPPAFIGDVRQSDSRGDWIIKDNANLRSISAFAITAKTNDADIPIQSPTRSVLIPKPPAFYAEPDYIGSHSFVGRAREVEELGDWAKPADPTNLLLFEAIGGNGKSMLTWEWTTRYATSVRSDWAGRFWYSFYEKGAIMADFCQRALAYMTQRPLVDFRNKKTSELAEDLLAQLHARPWLLILDGLERVLVAYHRIDAAEVSDEEADSPTDKIGSRNPCDAIRDEDNTLLRALAAAAPSKILVSSRLTPRVLLNPSGQPITGARRITLPGLRPPDAETLLRSCGIEGDSSAIQSYLTANCDNHPLVIGILGGLINQPGKNRGNFDAWAVDPQAGAALNLASLDLIQRRNDILRAALDALSPESRQLLSTLALLTESVDYETLQAFNPHLYPELAEVEEPGPPEKHWNWEALSDKQKADRQKQYDAAFLLWQDYERAVQARTESAEVRAAPKKLEATVADLEQRGLLQWDSRERKYNLHPVVRGVASGGMAAADRERQGQRVVDYFSAQPHRPYAEVESLEDVSNSLHVVRTLIRMERYEQAADTYYEQLGKALYSTLDAHREVLSLLRPFFPEGWATLPTNIDLSDAAYLANCAGNALGAIGQNIQAAQSYESALKAYLRLKDWENLNINIGAYAWEVKLPPAERCLRLATALADLSQDIPSIITSKFSLYILVERMGRWEEADMIWETLVATDIKNSRYTAGYIKLRRVSSLHRRGQPDWAGWSTVKELIESSKSAQVLRFFHENLGYWRLEQGEWALAAASLQEAVRMARERSLLNVESETGLALAKYYLGQLTDPHHEAERLAQLRNPSHRHLAQLWLALGNPVKAKHHALAAYEYAWADGEPYVDQYELTQATKLLQQMNVPLPELPPYDPGKDEPLPWEADVRAVIEQLRAEKQSVG